MNVLWFYPAGTSVIKTGTIVGEPLKNHFGAGIPARIAEMISGVFPGFDREAFVGACLDGYHELELVPRGRKISTTLRDYLPVEYPAAIEILIASIGPRLETTEGHGMAPFLYLPHVCYVAEFGLEHFEESMRAQYELTQRFSAEFSIRPFLERLARDLDANDAVGRRAHGVFTEARGEAVTKRALARTLRAFGRAILDAKGAERRGRLGLRRARGRDDGDDDRGGAASHGDHRGSV